MPTLSSGSRQLEDFVTKTAAAAPALALLDERDYEKGHQSMHHKLAGVTVRVNKIVLRRRDFHCQLSEALMT